MVKAKLSQGFILNTSYRNEARLALSRARMHLDSKDDTSLRYAALELRLALECLVYERAQNYKDELPKKKLSTWQPRQLLNILLEINPYADKTSTISIGIEEEYGVQPDVMTLLGTDRVISLGEIKEFYDRLGSYLHTPTIEQTEQGKGIPGERLRISCEELCKIVESSLNSKVRNADFKNSVKLPCGNCGKEIIRRVTNSEDSYQATCIDCGATYTITKAEGNKYNWKANLQEVACANPDCDQSMPFWQKDLVLNKHWICAKCNGTNRIELCVSYYPKEST